MKEKTSVVFTGDIGFDRFMAGKWEDPQLLSRPLLDFFHSADHVVANVEGALIKAEDNGSHGSFFHSMDPEASQLLTKIGADFWSFGNNHTMDAGKEGVESTKAIAEKLGAKTFGGGLNLKDASAPVFIDEAGGIGMFCVSYMNECVPATDFGAGIFPWNYFQLIEKRIKEIKAKCRWCVVVSHGGEEFTSIPFRYTRDRYLKFLEMGADAVVAHHPHVPQNYETFADGRKIFYSLGNFIFDTPYQRVHPNTDRGVLLKLNFTEDELGFDAQGFTIVRGDERLVDSPLPGIFEDIQPDEYEKLYPLACKVFVNEEKKKMIYLEPEKYKDASDETWRGYFFGFETDGYFEGEHMDLSLIVPVAESENGEWKDSKLEGVKKYLLDQLD